MLDEVCDKICRKIGWTDPLPRRDVIAFLRDFYTAERAFLEREQLYGKARPDKYTRPGRKRMIRRGGWIMSDPTICGAFHDQSNTAAI